MPINLSSSDSFLLRTLTMPVTFKVANEHASSFPCKGMKNVEDLTNTLC